MELFPRTVLESRVLPCLLLRSILGGEKLELDPKLVKMAFRSLGFMWGKSKTGVDLKSPKRFSLQFFSPFSTFPCTDYYRWVFEDEWLLMQDIVTAIQTSQNVLGHIFESTQDIRLKLTGFAMFQVISLFDRKKNKFKRNKEVVSPKKS